MPAVNPRGSVDTRDDAENQDRASGRN
jgi:hypothetical protein